MVKINLGPLDSKVATELARQRGVTVDGLIVALLHEEAAMSLVGLRRLPGKAGVSDGK